MTAHLISVGLSLRESMLRSGPGRLFPPGIQPLAFLECPGIDPLAHLLSTLAPAGPDRDDAARAQLWTLAEDVGIRSWPAAASAELSSLPPSTIAATDAVLLLCSDTVKGLNAGLWNALAMAGGDLDHVHFQPDATQPLDEVRGEVTIVRIEGMDIGDEAGFRTAMRAVGMLGRNLLDGGIPKNEPIRCHLSGGYKAAIPYLIAVAEGLRSHPDNHEVDAVVLHEETTSGPIRLPLRRVPEGALRSELRHFDDEGLSRVTPTSQNLEGWAYERDGSGWRLTSFGEGMRELFDIPAATQ